MIDDTINKPDFTISPERQSPIKAYGFSRRGVLKGLGAAVSAAFFAHKTIAYASDELENGFFNISCSVTGHHDLDPIIAQRLFNALRTVFSDYDQKLNQLSAHINLSDTPADILQKAQETGYADTVHDLVAAWYIGTADRRMNAPMVSYYDALMYRPTRDALPVPTYCFAEPGWWTQPPPELGISVQSPKDNVPPAPLPAAVETKPAPAVPLRPHLPAKHKEH